MPAYDPKRNRPPRAGDESPAPVDALIDLADSSPSKNTTPEIAPAADSPEIQPTRSLVADGLAGRSRQVLIAAVVVAVLILLLVRRKRGN